MSIWVIEKFWCKKWIIANTIQPFWVDEKAARRHMRRNFAGPRYRLAEYRRCEEKRGEAMILTPAGR